MNFLGKFEDARFGWAVLGLAMLASGIVVMYIGRGTTFSGDEMVWVASTPGIDLNTLLSPHGGHLQLIPRAVYKVMLSVAGLEYWPYRLLTVLASWLTTGLLFAWLSKRVPVLVALAPCMILLVFGSDALHVIQGNGFTILVSVAAGIGALLALDRPGTKWAVAASAMLVIGVMTYGIALAFVVGVAVKVLTQPGRRRWWVPIVPILVFGIWWIWARTAGPADGNGGLELANLALVPAWSFQAAGASLDALIGLSYNFGGSAKPALNAAPALAIATVILVIWSFLRPGTRTPAFVVLAIGISLWALQALVAEPGGSNRLPDDVRYMLPGAIVMVMILAEATQNVRWNFTLVVAVWLAAFCGLGVNLKLLADNGGELRTQATFYKDTIGALSLATEGYAIRDSSRDQLVESVEGGLFAMTRLPWGELGTAPSVLETRSDPVRNRVDGIAASARFLKLTPFDGALRGCRRVEAGTDGSLVGKVPADGMVLVSPVDAELLIGRFGDAPTVSVGAIPGGEAQELPATADGYDRNWKFAVDGSTGHSPSVKLCRAPRSRGL